MKKLSLFILLISSAFTTFAQTTFDKSSVFIGLGQSIPMGDFSLKDPTNEKAGLAAVGGHLDLGYQLRFSKNVGAIAMFKGRIYGISKESLNYALPTGSGGSLAVDASTWKMGAVLVGLAQFIPPSNNELFTLEFREAAGVQFTSSPSVDVNYNITGLQTVSASQESESASSFAYLLGLGFRYQISNHLGVKIYGDFNNSNVKFKDITIITGATTSTELESRQKTGSIDVGVGLTIGL